MVDAVLSRHDGVENDTLVARVAYTRGLQQLYPETLAECTGSREGFDVSKAWMKSSVTAGTGLDSRRSGCMGIC